MNSWKIIHQWFKQDLKINIYSYLYMFNHSKLWNMWVSLQQLFRYSYAKLRTHKKLCTNDSNKISNLIFNVIYTSCTILSFEIGIFSRKSFLHVRLQNENSWKIVNEWFQQDRKFNNYGYLYFFYNSEWWNRYI